jgi:hypothetical protein
VNNNNNSNNNNQSGRPTAKGRVYHIDGEEVQAATELIQGECEISGKLFPVLYDSGATHSFISWECVNSLQLPITCLPFNLVVTIPSSEPVTLNEACLQCPLTVLDMKFKFDLICIPLKRLGVILGMDWLSSHYVLLDCARKSVIFPDPGISRFLEANRLKFSLHGGVQKYVFLNSVNMSLEVDITVIPIVKDFPEVFPPDVPGLPPVRDVEFSIDITPGTGPISISPYRMSPPELVELKKQLEDLQSKGFYKTKCFTLGSSCIVGEEEGWEVEIVC